MVWYGIAFWRVLNVYFFFVSLVPSLKSKMRKDGKDSLLEHYSALFVQFVDEADALFSRGDHASAADVLMKATLYNKMLTDIEGGEGS